MPIESADVPVQGESHDLEPDDEAKYDDVSVITAVTPIDLWPESSPVVEPSTSVVEPIDVGSQQRFSRYGRPIKPVVFSNADYERADQSTVKRLGLFGDTTESEQSTSDLITGAVINGENVQCYAGDTNVSGLGPEPTTLAQAMQSSEREEWRKAYQQEMESHRQFRTWDVVPIKSSVKPIPCRLVFKRKLDSTNNIAKFKCRLVIKGFKQKFGIDYTDTASPVAKWKSLRTVIAYCAETGMVIEQADFNNAFLHAKMDSEVFMEAPPGVKLPPNHACRLNLALYGLKQAPLRWNKEIDNKLIKLGYTALTSDPCVYIKLTSGGRRIIICLYVDDTIRCYSLADREIMRSDFDSLAKDYSIKDLGEVKWLLNVAVTRNQDERTIKLDQSAMITRLLEDYNMEQCKSASTPSFVPELTTEETGEFLDGKHINKYQSLVGALLYLANVTRFDIAFAVGQLTRFTSKPCAMHWTAALHVLRYLSGTVDLGIVFGGSQRQRAVLVNDGPNQEIIKSPLVVYSDANWGSDRIDRRSVTGTLVMFNSAPVVWRSVRQKTVALSTCEAEYMALSVGVTEAIFFRTFLRELLGIELCVPICVDNSAAISVAKSDCLHAKTKHIDLRHHHSRQSVSDGLVSVKWVPSGRQCADVLTKGLSVGIFKPLVQAIAVGNSKFFVP
jgi:hypothetical protein